MSAFRLMQQMREGDVMRLERLAKLIKRVTNKKVTTPANMAIGGTENPYLLRWYLIPRNRFFNVYLHEIVRSDDDRALHDHPWWNVSFILDGTLFEVVPLKEGSNTGPFSQNRLVQGDLKFRNAEAAHRLIVLPSIRVRTLFITGPRIRDWGFWCPQGWRHWKDFTGFNETGDSTRIGRGCGEE